MSDGERDEELSQAEKNQIDSFFVSLVTLCRSYNVDLTGVSSYEATLTIGGVNIESWQIDVRSADYCVKIGDGWMDFRVHG